MTKGEEAKNGAKIVSSINGVGRSGQVQAKKRKKETRLETCTIYKINSRWMKDLNTSHDTMKVLEENIGRKISDIPHSNNFSNMSPRARDIKERINKWDLTKIKSICDAKENISKMKREPTI